MVKTVDTRAEPVVPQSSNVPPYRRDALVSYVKVVEKRYQWPVVSEVEIPTSKRWRAPPSTFHSYWSFTSVATFGLMGNKMRPAYEFALASRSMRSVVSLTTPSWMNGVEVNWPS